MKLSYVLALATVLGSSIHTSAMQQPKKDRRPIEPIFNNSDIQKQKQREYGSGLFGIGVGLLLKRHPIIAAFCLMSGAIVLTERKQCEGIKEMGEGLSTIRSVRPNDNAVQGAIELITGCGKFGLSVFRNGVALVNELVSNEATRKNSQSEESDE